MNHRVGPGDSGQILLLSALILAVLFVGLAVVVNGAIFTENIGTRSVDDSNMCSGKVVQHEFRTELVVMVDETNANATTDHATLRNEFETVFDSYANEFESTCSTRGYWVTVGLQNTSNGTRLRQTNESRAFTSKEGAWNWTLSDDVPDGGQFAMTIQGTSLYDDDLSVTLSTLQDEAFAVEFYVDGYSGDGNGAHRVFFYQGTASDNVYAVYEKPDQDFSGLSLETVDGWLNQTCIARGDTVSVRFQEGTYGGTPCGPLGFYDVLDAHNVTYENAKVPDGLGGSLVRARGSYDILLETTSYNTSAFHDAGDGQPFHQAAITSVNYTGESVSEERTLVLGNQTLTPHHYDRGGILRNHPEIDVFEITDQTTSGDPVFEVDWSVSDRDGDLERVELYLVHANDEVIVDAVNNTVSGNRADGADTLEDTRTLDLGGDDYTIVVTAVDADGRATTETRNQTAG